MRPRSEIVSEESTVNPIFLFQRRRVIPNTESLAEYSSEEECLVHPDTKEPMDDDDLLAHGWGEITWLPANVFATRKEGEDYGEATKHRYGKGRIGEDWRVYCIPCAGELAQILAIRPEILEFASAMESMMQTKTEQEKSFWNKQLELNKFGKKYDENYWKSVPYEVMDKDLHDTMNNLGQALCVHPHEKEPMAKLSMELAMYCMMNIHRAQQEKGINERGT